MTAKQVSAEVSLVEPVAAATFRIDLRARPIAAAAAPGQFVMVGPLLPSSSDPFLNRPISIAGVGSEGTIELIVGVVGRGTELLSQVRVGQRIGLLGPQGHGFSRALLPGQSLLLVAGGLGIAPLRFFAQSAVNQGVLVTLLYGARTAAHLVPLDEFKPGMIDVRRATEDGSVGMRGMVTDLLAEVLSREGDRMPLKGEIAACGPMPMMRTVSELGGRASWPVELSLESRMACGVGACLGCALDLPGGKRRACVDGPVFSSHEVFP
jgi:dihydroorotate dehydrogenase electron transfer subunit